MPVDICRHCLGPRTPGGADRLCGRCYRWSRRHDGALPSAPPRAGDLTEQLPPVAATPLLVRHVEAAARRERLSVAVWLRRAIEAAKR